jgi:hypothetical protein
MNWCWNVLSMVCCVAQRLHCVACSILTVASNRSICDLELAQVAVIVKREMENAVDLLVPTPVMMVVGKSLDKMEEYDVVVPQPNPKPPPLINIPHRQKVQTPHHRRQQLPQPQQYRPPPPPPPPPAAAAAAVLSTSSTTTLAPPPSKLDSEFCSLGDEDEMLDCLLGIDEDEVYPQPHPIATTTTTTTTSAYFRAPSASTSTAPPPPLVTKCSTSKTTSSTTTTNNPTMSLSSEEALSISADDWFD